jgi:predicted RecB family endonuclease
MNNFFMWLELVANLSSVVANQAGNAPKELAYLDVLITGAREGTLTDEAVLELRMRYKEEKLAGIEPTPADLESLKQRLLMRSAQIQGAGQ